MPQQHQLKLVGMFFHPPANAILKVLPSGHPLTITHRPDNEYDPNALEVSVSTKSLDLGRVFSEKLDEELANYGYELSQIGEQESWMLGFIAKAEAAVLVKDLDRFQLSVLRFTTEGKPLVLLTTGD